MENPTETNSKEQSTRRKGASPKWRWRLLIVLFLIIVAAAFTPEIRYLLSHESTDDAYFRSTIVPVSSQVAGQVVKVFVQDNQLVRAGDPLLEIDPRDYQLALNLEKAALATAKADKVKEEAEIIEAQKTLSQTRAGLVDAQVNEQFAAREKRRYDGLAKMGAVSQHKYEQVKTTWQAYQAKRNAADSAVARSQAAIKTWQAGLDAQESKIKEVAAKVEVAKLALSRTKITAPINGRISQRNVDEGKYVLPGQPLLALVDSDNPWIAANFKETQIDKIKIGQPVDIKVDAYPDLVLKGHVDSMQAGTGAVFSLLPPENATGNFVKIVQRLPVKIVVDSAPDPAHPLYPGLSAVPSIDVDAKPKR